MDTTPKTQQLRAGSKTYFFTIESTKQEQSPYLKITESRYKGDEDGRPVYEKQSIYVFPEHVNAFAQAVTEMAKNLVAEEASAASD